MRGLCCFLAVILIFPTVQLGLPSSLVYQNDTSSSSDGGLLDESYYANSGDSNNLTDLIILEVCPSYSVEFVAIRNDGAYELDLKGISLSDGEGTATFCESLTLGAGKTVVICSNISSLGLIGVFDHAVELGGRYLISNGTFRLADKGDEVLLLSPTNHLFDAFVYGSSEYSGEGWKGPPFPKLNKGHSAKRVGYPDMDNAGDWRTTVPGRSSLPCPSGWYSVEPFIIPVDGRERLIREIDFSSRTILMAIYKIDDSAIVDRLCRSSIRGVNVTILLEGQPVAGIGDNERDSLGILLASGVDVRLLQSYEGYKRYQYLHCKYAVFDGHRTCVMSENLMAYSLEFNRGWGVMVESEELARYFASIFNEDADLSRIDVREAMKVDFPAVAFPDQKNISFSSVKYLKFSCLVRPIISPDFSYEQILEIISNAHEEILVQQLYCDLSVEDDLLIELVNGARRGVKVRILLDSSFFAQYGSDNVKLVELVNEIGTSENIDLQARMASRYHDFTVLHNKGVIVDDHVIVSSINWCESAFNENRETGLILSSCDVADFFSRFFWNDWNDDPYPPVANIDGAQQAFRDEMISLSARNSSDNAGISEYLWDLDGDGIFEQSGSMIVMTFPEGMHTVTLRVTDVFNNSADDIHTIRVLPKPQDGIDLMLFSPLMLVVPLLVWLLRKVKGR
jgi:cardiolipin synthase